VHQSAPPDRRRARPATRRPPAPRPTPARGRRRLQRSTCRESDSPEPRGGSGSGAAHDLVVSGGDGDPRRAPRDATGMLVSFVASPSDLARAVGATPERRPGLAPPMDAIKLDDGTLAVSAVVLDPTARPIDGATAVRRHRPAPRPARSGRDGDTVVVATGQWLRGLDLVPQPSGDRKASSVCRLRRPERQCQPPRDGHAPPHPRIVTRTAVEIESVPAFCHSARVDSEAPRAAASSRPARPASPVDLTARRYHRRPMLYAGAVQRRRGVKLRPYFAISTGRCSRSRTCPES
jgi:hypothetical protein